MFRNRFGICRRWLWALVCASAIALSACSLPQVQAEDRVFLDLSLEFLDAYTLDQQVFEDTPIGGLSGLTYDRQRDRFYAISDDRSKLAPARFYTLNVKLNRQNGNSIDSIEVEGVTFLKNDDGQTYKQGHIDPEDIALSPNQTVFVVSEGNPKYQEDGIDPFVREYDLATGESIQPFPLPPYYIPDAPEAEQTLGVQTNLGFEALTLNNGGSIPNGEPFRVFVATESALVQDAGIFPPPDENTPPEGEITRLLHYLVTDNRPSLLAEHLYRLDVAPLMTPSNGLTDLVSIDPGGHFLSLERTYGLGGFGAKIFQLAFGDATDISGRETLQGNISNVIPIRKRLMLDLKDLDIPLDNFEGMTLGPLLADGSQSLLLVSDDNFQEEQTTQFLLFRIFVNG
ncbi:MAG TPA: esterase-like activity of phytase family protein [Oscillatoriales cyanobacterium M59_W2019_021]|nr:MAG: esterase-like activity of phytase family protein [Cyanobacteria bacterium J055]HIK30284.1 esterase-like activity of phytase family protein [Oscillatoriales cyanobacterium M4454_W2019_049]HIK53455.1 esterase-like activity of phytase family protein [Oscillatoriales cyanobacterium M59_W2019_021]